MAGSSEGKEGPRKWLGTGPSPQEYPDQNEYWARVRWDPNGIKFVCHFAAMTINHLFSTVVYTS